MRTASSGGGVRGADCAECGAPSKVVDSRPREDALRRRRECLDCGRRFTTYEVRPGQRAPEVNGHGDGGDGQDPVLEEQAVLEMRADRREALVPFDVLAEAYGCSRSAARRAVRGEHAERGTFTDLPGAVSPVEDAELRMEQRRRRKKKQHRRQPEAEEEEEER